LLFNIEKKWKKSRMKTLKESLFDSDIIEKDMTLSDYYHIKNVFTRHPGDILDPFDNDKLKKLKPLVKPLPDTPNDKDDEKYLNKISPIIQHILDIPAYVFLRKNSSAESIRELPIQTDLRVFCDKLLSSKFKRNGGKLDIYCDQYNKGEIEINIDNQYQGVLVIDLEIN